MPITAPLKQLLTDTIPDWNHNGTPQNTRENLWKIVRCGTAALGAEVFASTTHRKIVYHTCKSRFCPSCRARTAVIWQSKLEAAIPDIPYREINFTMPRVFWSLFQQNRDLLNDLPAVGARAIENEARCSCDSHGRSADLWRVSQFLSAPAYLNLSRRIGQSPSSFGFVTWNLRTKNADMS